MNGNNDHLELAYYSVHAFGNDGKLDEAELDKLLDIAIKDGKVDEDETRVLKKIFSQLKGHELNHSMRDKIRQIEAKYAVSLL